MAFYLECLLLSSVVLAPVFEQQNISQVIEQRLRSALTSFGL
jgi:hypothetical protein